MNEIQKYLQEVKARCAQIKTKENVDYSELINLFEEYLSEGKNDVNLKKAKKRLKDILVEAIVEGEENKQKRLKAVIGIYYLTDFQFDEPNSPKAIREICKDTQLSFPEYLMELVLLVAEKEAEKGSQK